MTYIKVSDDDEERFKHYHAVFDMKGKFLTKFGMNGSELNICRKTKEVYYLKLDGNPVNYFPRANDHGERRHEGIHQALQEEGYEPNRKRSASDTGRKTEERELVISAVLTHKKRHLKKNEMPCFFQ